MTSGAIIQLASIFENNNGRRASSPRDLPADGDYRFQTVRADFFPERSLCTFTLAKNDTENHRRR